jgi:hypothetical protein
MPMEDVLNNNILPHELAELVVRCNREGWPQVPAKIFVEKK